MSSSIQQAWLHRVLVPLVDAGAKRSSSTPTTIRSTIIGWRFTNRRANTVADEDILHAIDHALAIEDVAEEPDRWLLIGPDRAGNLLEVVVLLTVEADQLVIHAMPMRPQYRKLLEQ